MAESGNSDPAYICNHNTVLNQFILTAETAKKHNMDPQPATTDNAG
jgi:hypothetical protein